MRLSLRSDLAILQAWLATSTQPETKVTENSASKTAPGTAPKPSKPGARGTISKKNVFRRTK